MTWNQYKEKLAGKTIRYHLEDRGQDLLYFDIKEGTIVAAGPYHHNLYAGKLHYDYYGMEDINVGGHIRYSDSPKDGVYTIQYPVVSVEELRVGRVDDN